MHQNLLFNEQNPPSPQEVNRLPVQRDRVGGWNNYELDSTIVDVTGTIALTSLPADTKFVISSGIYKCYNIKGNF